jgi:predicted transcriptional regulator
MEFSMAGRQATRVVTSHIPEDLAERLDDYADEMERSRGWIMKQALASWLDWEDEKLRLSREALEEARQVGFIPHEEVVAYFKSLDTNNPLPRPQPRKR